VSREPLGIEQLEDRRLLATYTVSSSSDNGDGLPGTLSAAINAANDNVGVDTIIFSVSSVSLTTANSGEGRLPKVTEGVTIGNPDSTNLNVLINGDGAPNGNLLEFDPLPPAGGRGGAITLRNLDLFDAQFNAIRVYSLGSAGMAVSNVNVDYFGSYGINVSTTGNIVIENSRFETSTKSGSLGGVTLNGGAGTLTGRITNTTIGRPNGTNGGGLILGANVGIFSVGAGTRLIDGPISVSSMAKRGISAALTNVRSSTGQFLDLGQNGPTENDPDDGDTGPNDVLNYPEIKSVEIVKNATSWSIPYDLDVDAIGSYDVEFFREITVTGGKRLESLTKVTQPVTQLNTNGPDFSQVQSIPFTLLPATGGTIYARLVNQITNHPNFTGTSETSPGVVVVDAAPRVVDMVIRGSSWTPGVDYSYATEVGLGRQLRPLPTQNANTIEVHFDRQVSLSGSTNGSELRLVKTVHNGDGSEPTTEIKVVAGVAPWTFYYDAPNAIGRWTLDTPLADGKYAIHLTGVTGDGRALDGHWVNEFNTSDTDANTMQRVTTLDNFTGDLARPFAVGNGEGEAFRFHFALLAGDYNRDGVVTPGETITGDGNGDGIIDTTAGGADAIVRNNNQNDILPLRKVQGADLIDNDRVFAEDLAQWRMYFATVGPNSGLGDIDGDNDTNGGNFLAYQRQQNDAASAWYEGADPIPVPVVGNFAPWVANVIVSGSMSAHAAFSFDTVDGSGLQLRTVPVGGADTITIVFSEDVNVAAEDLFLVGLRTGNMPTLATFSYDAVTHAATWRFSGWALGDQYLLALSDAVTDADTNKLDGEWTNPLARTTTNAAVSEFPSGDGDPGGWFTFVMALLPGDANLDSIIDSADWSMAASNWGVGPGKLFTQGDFNGDGAVNNSDITYFYSPAISNLQSLKIKGDVNGDGVVNDNDLNIIGLHAGATGATLADGDANGDGSVTQADLDLAFAQMATPWWQWFNVVS
jgi:hypothetical protein